MVFLRRIAALVFALALSTVTGCGAGSRIIEKRNSDMVESEYSSSFENSAAEKNITAVFDGEILSWQGGAEYYYVYIDGEKVCRTEDVSFLPEVSAGLHGVQICGVYQDGSEVFSDTVEIAVPYPSPVVYADGRTLKWDLCSDAAGYNIYKEGAFIAQIQVNFYFCDEDGAYSVSLAFDDERLNSPRSNSVIVAENTGDAPVLSLEGDVLKWSAVPDSQYYSIKVNGKTVMIIEGTVCDISDYFTMHEEYSGEVKLTVSARFENGEGTASNEVSYVVSAN